MQTKYGFAQADWNAIKAEMRDIMADIARAGTTVTYGELAQMLQVATVHPYSFAFGALLREICYSEDEAGRGLLCAVVVQKATGLPGMGFFKAMAKRGYDIQDLRQCWEEIAAPVYWYWQNEAVES